MLWPLVARPTLTHALFFRVLSTCFALTVLAMLSFLDTIEPFFGEHPALGRVVASLLLLLAMTTLRSVIHRMLVRRSRDHMEDARRWMVLVRNLILLGTMFGLVVIWAEELRTVAVSLVAFTAAVVLATKELIMNISGGIYRTAARPFAIGDRIEIGAFRGDVIDETLLSTKLLEIGPGANSHQYTGRAITIPNSQLLAQTVLNESYTDAYVLHVTSVPAPLNEWQLAEDCLLRAVQQECAEYLEPATAHLNGLADKRGLARPSVEPRVILQPIDNKKIMLTARYPVLAREKGRTEQAIMRRYLDEMTSKSGSEPDDIEV